jgi:uncharacterized protein YbaR (Trm112 family)
MHTYLIEMLECPACHSELDWTLTERSQDRIQAAEARCSVCAASYPVRDGIGLFLLPELPRTDLWEQVDSHLTQYLHEHPDVERQLMEAPLDTLAPADQFFRAMVLDERGNYAEAEADDPLLCCSLSLTRGYSILGHRPSLKRSKTLVHLQLGIFRVAKLGGKCQVILRAPRYKSTRYLRPMALT